jgi:hypothetical protein
MHSDTSAWARILIRIESAFDGQMDTGTYPNRKSECGSGTKDEDKEQTKMKKNRSQKTNNKASTGIQNKTIGFKMCMYHYICVKSYS